MSEIVTAVVLGVLGFLASEAMEWVPWLSKALLRSAARYVPSSRQDRMREEWLGELAVIPGKLGPLLWALSIWWGFAKQSVRIRWSMRASRAAIRLQDFVLAEIFLVTQFPLFLVIATTIKLSQPGPILYRRRAFGANGKVIFVYLFMTLDPSTLTPSRFGIFLRKTGLDQLPMVWNIIRGSLSIVGPSPKRAVISEMNFPSDPRKPGLVWVKDTDSSDAAEYGVRLVPTLRLYVKALLQAVRAGFFR